MHWSKKIQTTQVWNMIIFNVAAGYCCYLDAFMMYYILCNEQRRESVTVCKCCPINHVNRIHIIMPPFSFYVGPCWVSASPRAVLESFISASAGIRRARTLERRMYVLAFLKDQRWPLRSRLLSACSCWFCADRKTASCTASIRTFLYLSSDIFLCSSLTWRNTRNT